MNDSRFRTIVLMVCFPAIVGFLCPKNVAAVPWWRSSMNVESKVGTDRSIQSMDVMYPLSHSKSSLTFTDLRGRIDDDQSVEVNLGLAHRTLMNDPVGLSDESVLGFYGFADRLESEFDNVFYQATAGFEYFTKNYSFRFNGYLPEDERKPTTTFTQLEATGTQIFFENRQNYERPLPGFDVELGRTIRFEGWQLYGRGSYFRFHHSDVAEIEGSRFRTGVQLSGSMLTSYLSDKSQLTLGAEWQTDGVRGDQTFGVLRMRIPFGTVESQKSKVKSQKPQTTKANRPDDVRLSTSDVGLKSWQKDRLTERITRDVDIVTGRANRSTVTDTDLAVLAATGETLNQASIARSGSKSLSAAVNEAGADGTVLVVGTVKTDGVLVPAGQKILEGNGTVLESPDGTNRVVLGSSQSTATIKGTSTTTLLHFQTGTRGQVIRDLTLIGGNHAIRADHVNNFTIDNVTIKNTSGNAISFNNTDNVTITNSMIEGTVNAGNSFSGRITASRVGSLSIGNNSTGRVEDVTVTNGNFHIGESTATGSGNRFIVERVDVLDGNLSIEDYSASNQGLIRLESVDVSGRIDLADEIAEDLGSFSMIDVEAGKQVTVGEAIARTGGYAEFRNLTVESGGVSIGSHSGYYRGYFAIRTSTVTGGMTLDNNAADASGEALVLSNTIKTGDLELLGGSNQATVTDNTVTSGNLIFPNHLEGTCVRNNVSPSGTNDC